MHSLLNWLPRKAAICRALAVDSYSEGGFHPKVMIWKTPSGKCSCLVGSSNLSKAAFSSNYECNVTFSTDNVQYERMRLWLESGLKHSSEITPDFITEDYKEALPTRKKRQGQLRFAPTRINRPDSPACRKEVRAAGADKSYLSATSLRTFAVSGVSSM